jgi:hypothetical protein
LVAKVDRRITMPPLRTFKGTSKTGNVQKALDAAIQAAQQAVPGADRIIVWTLKAVSGRQGGITGLREVTVTIRARVS